MQLLKVSCGSHMPDSVRAALRAIVSCIIPSMFKAQQPWALMGSTASVLQGLDNYTPPDIDLVTSTPGAYIMEGCVGGAGATLRPVGWSIRAPYESHFGIFEVKSVKVEVMGDLIIRCPDGVISVNEHFARWSDKVKLVEFESYHVPVVPLEWQLVANVLLRRPERSVGVSQLLLEKGFDRPYMEALLDDEKLGVRTIGTVREMMALD